MPFVAPVQQQTNDPDEMYAEVKRLVDAEKYKEAGVLCNKILDIQPHPIVANMLGYCLYNLNKEDYAERVWRGALELDPKSVPVLANLGNLLRERMRYRQAEDMLSKAIRCKPNDHRSHHNMATLLLDLGRWEEALESAKTAYKLKKDEVATQHLLSLAHMQNGDFKNGIKHYGARKQLFLRDKAPLPRYEGGEAKVIVRHEQGMGDTIMAARWLPRLKEMGADVTLVCHRPLESLISRSNLAKIHKEGDTDYTHHLWTMDLLEMFAGEWDDLGGEAYLTADNDMIAELGAQLPKGKPRIGICWSGGFRPNDIGAFVIDKRRSMTAQDVVSLFDGLDCHVVNLTREWGLPNAIDFSFAIGDFDEQAALISNLDLVITVDTALCHLAGGLGVPTWMLSRYDACWRWWPYEKRSRLYNSVDCYFQSKMMDWQGVLHRVRHDLEIFLDAED